VTVVTGHVSLFAGIYQRIFFKKISSSDITGSSVNEVTAADRTAGSRCTEWTGNFPDMHFHNPTREWLKLIFIEARFKGSSGIRYFKQPGGVHLPILVRGLFHHVLLATQINDSGKV
jgi:hypothetical protein